jgi:hypothetical protein
MFVDRHRHVAVVPPAVVYTSSLSSPVVVELANQQAGHESQIIQRELYTWFLRRKQNRRLSQQIQDLETTNALLNREGFPEVLLTTDEICRILHVDGILISSFNLHDPHFGRRGLMSEIFSSYKILRGNIHVMDCRSGELIWSFNNEATGGRWTLTEWMVAEYLRGAQRRFPYR